jgi:hypothetical protein
MASQVSTLVYPNKCRVSPGTAAAAKTGSCVRVAALIYEDLDPFLCVCLKKLRPQEMAASCMGFNDTEF